MSPRTLAAFVVALLAFGVNRAQSFRISAGEGSDLFTPGKKQEIQTGEGTDLSMRLSLLNGRIEMNTTYYSNFQPNSRISPAPARSTRRSATSG